MNVRLKAQTSKYKAVLQRYAYGKNRIFRRSPSRKKTKPLGVNHPARWHAVGLRSPPGPKARFATLAARRLLVDAEGLL